MTVAVLCGAHFVVVVGVGELEVGSGVVEGGVDEFDVHSVARQRQDLGSKGVSSCSEEVSDERLEGENFFRGARAAFLCCVLRVSSLICAWGQTSADGSMG